MKKKLLSLALVTLLLAVLSFGTLAWFTDEDEVTNVFQIGSVEIEQIEEQIKEGTADEKEPFRDGKVLIPVVNVSEPAADPNYQDKIVTVRSTGKNPAYVRVHIAVPTALLPVLALDYEENTEWKEFDYTQTAAGANPTVDADGIEYTVFTFTYMQAIGTGEATDITEVLLRGVYLESFADCKEVDDGRGGTVRRFCYDDNGSLTYCDFDADTQVKVLVASQAVQTEGFDDPLRAMTAAFNDQHPFGG